MDSQIDYAVGMPLDIMEELRTPADATEAPFFMPRPGRTQTASLFTYDSLCCDT